MAEIKELTENNFDEFIKEGNTLVDFYADWNMSCLTMSPIIEEISEKLKNKIKVGKVDVGENKSIAEKFKVNSTPKFIIFREGEQKEQFTGCMTAEELEKKIEYYL